MTVAFMPYLSGNTFLHRLDPRAKLALFFVAIVMSVIFMDIVYLASLVLFLLILAIISRIHFSLIFQFIKPIIPLFLFLIVFDTFFSSWGDDYTFQIGSVTLYGNGAVFGCAMVLRMLAMVVATIVVMVTTDSASVILAIRALGLPHKFAFMVSTAFRFVPTLMGKALMIQDAQKARGLRSGDEAEGFVKRVLAMVPIVIPLFVASLEMAEKLSLAMEARGFGARENLTYSRDLVMSTMDYVVLALSGIVVISAIVLSVNGYGRDLLGTLQAFNVL